MELNELCLGCIKQKGDLEICPHCGYKNDTQPSLPQYIKPGSVLNGKFLVGKALGHGGFGVTYIGFDLNLELKVCIKEYLPQTLATRTQNEASLTIYPGEKGDQFRQGIEKFLDEAKTVAKFNQHKNIVTVRDFFTENGTAYMVMDYIEGMDLKDYVMKKGRPLQFDEALNLLNPIMDALQTVHNAGLLHRDISPDNIFITNNETPILIDFGAARQYLNQDSGLSVILKPGYAPEEQYRRNGNSGPWSDIYALAATFYHVITGKKPVDSLDRLENDMMPPPSAFSINISPESERALLKALAVKSTNRYQNIADFQKDINVGNMGASSFRPQATPVSQQYNWGTPNTNTNIQSGTYPNMQVDNKKKGGVLKTVLIIAASVIGVVVLGTIIALVVFFNNDEFDDIINEPAQQVGVQEAQTQTQTQIQTDTSDNASTSSGNDSDISANSGTSTGTSTGTGQQPDTSQEVNPQPGQTEQMSQQTVVDDTPLEFIDPAFEYALRMALKKPSGAITQSEVNDIKTLEIYGDKFANVNGEDDYLLHYYNEKGYCIDGLEHVKHGEIKRVDDLSKLVNLEYLFIGFNEIANLDGIADCHNLKTAILPYNDITDVTPIYQASKLAKFALSKKDVNGLDDSNTNVKMYYVPFRVTDSMFIYSRIIDQADGHTLGVMSDGSVVVQGTKTNNKKTEVSDWKHIVQVSGGEDHSVGLRDDGTVVAIGSNEKFGQCNVNSWVDIKYISAGGQHTVGVKIDGTCVATGLNDEGQCDVSSWKDIIQVSCGYKHTLGLKSDGTVVAVGSNKSGRCQVDDWKDIAFISAGSKHSVGLKADGTVVGVGWNDKYQLDKLKQWKEVVSVAAGETYTAAVDANGNVLLSGTVSQKLATHKGATYVYGSNDSVVVLNRDGTFKGYGAGSYGKNNIKAWTDFDLLYLSK